MDVLVFDLDNTLIDRDSAIRAYLGSWGATGSALRDLLVADERGCSERLLYCERVVNAMGLPMTAQALWEHLQANLGTFCKPDLGRQALIARLRAQAKVVLLTNGGATNQRLKISRSGLEDAFDHVVVSGEIGVSKPAPEAFSACERWPGAQYTMIGDHPTHDIEGAALHGWATVWVSNGRLWTGAHTPDAQIDSVDSVESALQGLFK
jgi:HAD superfamily hydrolase (TIGR01549 family)